MNFAPRTRLPLLVSLGWQNSPWRFPALLLPVSTFTLLKEEKGSSGTKETAVGGFQRSILRELLMGARSRAEMELTAKSQCWREVPLPGLGQRLWGLFVEETNMLCSNSALWCWGTMSKLEFLCLSSTMYRILWCMLCYALHTLTKTTKRIHLCLSLPLWHLM